MRRDRRKGFHWLPVRRKNCIRLLKFRQYSDADSKCLRTVCRGKCASVIRSFPLIRHASGFAVCLHNNGKSDSCNDLKRAYMRMTLHLLSGHSILVVDVTRMSALILSRIKFCVTHASVKDRKLLCSRHSYTCVLF